MNRHLGLISATSKKVKYDTRATLFHKSITGNKGKDTTMEEIVKFWDDSHDKFATLKKLGKLFKQINDSHDKDLINQ